MVKTVYLGEHGDDKNNGLTDQTPVRTGAKAVKISIKIGAQEFRVLGTGTRLARLAQIWNMSARKQSAPSNRCPEQ